MAKTAYVGVSNLPKNVKEIYVGVDGTPKKVVKGYIGVNGVPMIFWEGNAPAGDIHYPMTLNYITGADDPKYLVDFQPGNYGDASAIYVESRTTNRIVLVEGSRGTWYDNARLASGLYITPEMYNFTDYKGKIFNITLSIQKNNTTSYNYNPDALYIAIGSDNKFYRGAPAIMGSVEYSYCFWVDSYRRTGSYSISSTTYSMRIPSNLPSTPMHLAIGIKKAHNGDGQTSRNGSYLRVTITNMWWSS